MKYNLLKDNNVDIFSVKYFSMYAGSFQNAQNVTWTWTTTAVKRSPGIFTVVKMGMEPNANGTGQCYTTDWYKFSVYKCTMAMVIKIFQLTNAQNVHTCLTPWYKQSQKSNKVPRKVAWKTASNIPGIQLSTRNVNGKSGSEIKWNV